MMSLGSEPAFPLHLGLAKVLSDKAAARCCVCFRCRLRILIRRTTRKMMMRMKMTQPAPIAAKTATLELKNPSLGPWVSCPFWLTEPARQGETGVRVHGWAALCSHPAQPLVCFTPASTARHTVTEPWAPMVEVPARPLPAGWSKIRAETSARPGSLCSPQLT